MDSTEASKYASKPEKWYYLEGTKDAVKDFLKCRHLRSVVGIIGIIGSSGHMEYMPCFPLGVRVAYCMCAKVARSESVSHTRDYLASTWLGARILAS